MSASSWSKALVAMGASPPNPRELASTPRFARALSIGLALVGLGVACSTPASADGASCSQNGNCESNRCSAGLCDGSDCTCDTPDCHSQASCLAGWLCTRGDAVSDEAVPRCRQVCSDSATCPSNKHCDNGVCKTGAAPFVLTWDSFPRARACAPMVPCPYAVHVSGGATVTTFTWTFGSAPPYDTKDPTTTFTYPMTGTFPVHVRAVATSGAVANLDETEVLCNGGPGATCDVQGAPCCQGICNVQGLCQ